VNKLRELLSALPPDALVPVGWVVEHLDSEAEEPCSAVDEPSWQVKLWEVPGETRLSVRDVAEATGHSTGWVYKRTCETATERIPHRKVNGGGLVFLAAEIREWLKAREAA
jgi:predicted DNA-binding transcriptional regulator AlpA